MMQQLLTNRANLKNLNYYFELLSEEQQKYFCDKIKNIKRKQLYKSPIHGQYHSEKVCLFAFLLANYYKLDETDVQIIVDAAIYHDFKRANDFEDAFHGYVSASQIEKVVPLEGIYLNRENFLLLQAIVDFHSQPDHRLEIVFENYELTWNLFERYKMLAYILKDSDALDRKRFQEKSQAALNEKFLRLNFSKTMIALSEEVNQEYYAMILENQEEEISLEKENNDCFHSIGFDFFRIQSVLKHGILSFSEMTKQNLSFPRNFDGGNSHRWISVVPANLLFKKDIAYQTFIQNGIVFFCESQDLYVPLDYNQRSEAILKGLPFDKSGYKDERYVFLKIQPNSIIGIFVTKQNVSKNITELSYLYNTLYYESLEQKIIYFLNSMGIESIKQVPELVLPMALYKKRIDEYQSLELSERVKVDIQMNHLLSPTLDEINAIIQKLIHQYYVNLLGKKQEDRITVGDVIKYEIVKSGKNMTMLDGKKELLFFTEIPKQKVYKK